MVLRKALCATFAEHDVVSMLTRQLHPQNVSAIWSLAWQLCVCVWMSMTAALAAWAIVSRLLTSELRGVSLVYFGDDPPTCCHCQSDLVPRQLEYRFQIL
eukprot:1831959-Amphidinium_carterae.1